MRVIDLVSIADIFTVLNALFGFAAVIIAIEGELQGWANGIQWAYLLVILSVLADGLDGIVARRFGLKWKLGDFLDIMADSVSFALAPAVLLYLTFRSDLGAFDLGLSVIAGRALLLITGGMLIVTGVSRLARFCFETGGADNFFLGLPIPTTALMMILCLMLGFPGVVVVALVIISCALMVSDLKWPKPRGMMANGTGILLLILVVVVAFQDWTGIFGDILTGLALFSVLSYSYLGPYVYKRYALALAPVIGEGPLDEEEDEEVPEEGATGSLADPSDPTDDGG
jgi:CDP-diacylglycerol--serine O-phosphatidyltransferase